MNDYSKYIKSPYGFIRQYKVVNGNILQVFTSRSKKNQPNEYELTEENKRKYDRRLGQQYELLHQNSQEIKKDLSKTARKKFYTVGAVILALALTVGILANVTTVIPAFISTIGMILGGSVMAIGELSLAIWKIHFDNYIKDQQTYMQQREYIELRSYQDHNVTKNLSQNAQQVIKSKEELRNSAVSTETFDIDFMDKISASDLSTLIDAYMISTELENHPRYVSPTPKAKTKTRKPNNKHKAR